MKTKNKNKQTNKNKQKQKNFTNSIFKHNKQYTNKI